MTNLRSDKKGKGLKVVEKYGRCAELVPIDPNFHQISVGLYLKGGIGTVWTFSNKLGVEARIEQIRDQLVKLGGMKAVEATHNMVNFECGGLHARSLRFLVAMAVEKPPDHVLPIGKTKDLRSDLKLGFSVTKCDSVWVYKIVGEGEATNAPQRMRAVRKGLVRYGEMEESGGDGVVFDCGYRHDELVQLTMPYARNITGVEDQMAADALRGQMTTGTLGFTPPS